MTSDLGCIQVLEVTVDASNVPGEYALTILSECAAFPRRLVFFLKGSLSVSRPLCLCFLLGVTGTCSCLNMGYSQCLQQLNSTAIAEGNTLLDLLRAAISS